MPHFILHCLDKPGSLELRMSVRPQHLDYARDHAAMIRVAGPLLDEAGALCGSCFVLEAETRVEAEAFAANDPYAQAGLFGQVLLHPYRPLIGDWPSVAG